MTESAKRYYLFETLSRLPKHQFDQLAFSLKVPSGNIPSSGAAQADCVLAFLLWAESPIGCGLDTVTRMLSVRFGCTEKDDNSYSEQEYLEIVRDYKFKLKNTIKERCSTVRILNMSQPVSIEEIFTNVNIIENLASNCYMSAEDLAIRFNPDNVARVEFGKFSERCFPGLEVMKKHKKLKILGRPGSGKTTFLRWLAISCIENKYETHSIPIYIELREYASMSHGTDLFQYIALNFQDHEIKKDELNSIFRNGDALILLDGLDEVRESDYDRVIYEIRAFTYRFSKCKYALTCRTATREYTFENFVDVEIADFNSEQIEYFVNHWFNSKGKNQIASLFLEKLRDEETIQEIASTPLLLTLLCTVFEDTIKFPFNRAELYEEGLYVLLKKWDASRNVEREDVYRHLSMQRKRDMLGKIALSTFENHEYFFNKKKLEESIFEYIKNIPAFGIDEDDLALALDSEAILKAIESQHGILVERAKGVYSFSHLTFQEYFSARRIVRDSSADSYLEKLSSYVGSTRWNEVFLLVVSMLDDASNLILMMEKEIHKMFSIDEELVHFFEWLEVKTSSVGGYSKPAIRAYYFSVGGAIKRISNLVLDLDLAIEIDKSFVFSFEGSREIALDRSLILLLDVADALTFAVNEGLEIYFILDLIRDLEVLLSRDIKPVRKVNFSDIRPLVQNKEADISSAIHHALNFIVERALNHAQGYPIYENLNSLLLEVPKNNIHSDAFLSWWSDYGCDWSKKLRDLLIRYRNIGHGWKIHKEQQQRLENIYYSTHLLVKCLNSDCHINASVRDRLLREALMLPSCSRTL